MGHYFYFIERFLFLACTLTAHPSVLACTSSI